MKPLFFILFLFAQWAVAQEISIIPKPASLLLHEGNFTLSKSTRISVQDPQDRKAADFLNAYLQEYYGFKLPVSQKKQQKNSISFSTRQQSTAGGKDSYILEVAPGSITVAGSSPAGTFYGMQTLIQLLPVEKNTTLILPAVSVQDSARFGYRGMHLDVARHMFPLSFIKQYLDYLALHKMNYFHWHLTEDQGWRLEIKKYPKLTEVGAYREGTIIGRYPGTGNDSLRYGGFYTQEEAREIVQYAADRHITVIPEIEMPGHSSAALTAYPWLGCPGTGPYQVEQTWGIFEDVYCAGNDSTFMFLQDVMDEVLTIFPSPYIHIGGDESPKANWRKCPRCQQRIKKEGLADEHELQSYFIQRMEKYINAKGRTIIGWDEILEGGLAPNAIVMSWRGEEGGIAAARQDHYVVMTPGSHVYFDHSQSQREDSVTIGGFTTLEKVYHYEPIPKELDAAQAKYVLGAQANVWTEYMKTPAKVEYMIFPRISALSEVLWTAPEKKDWQDFEKRLMTQFKRYELWDAKYSLAYYDIKASVAPNPGQQGVLASLEAKKDQGKLLYTLNKDSSTKAYTGPLPITASTRLTAFYYKEDQLLDSLSINFNINKATGKAIQLQEEPSSYFPGNGAFTLVDGILNKAGGRTQESLGFSGTDVTAIIDLGTTESISSVSVHALNAGGTYVYPPQAVEVYGSADGQQYTPLGNTDGAYQQMDTKSVFKVDFAPADTRYVKVVVKSPGSVPDGKSSAGEPTWLFLDEIEIH